MARGKREHPKAEGVQDTWVKSTDDGFVVAASDEVGQAPLAPVHVVDLERPSFEALLAAAQNGGFVEVSTVSPTSVGHSSGGVRVTPTPRRVELAVVLARSKAHLEHLANDSQINIRIVE